MIHRWRAELAGSLLALLLPAAGGAEGPRKVTLTLLGGGLEIDAVPEAVTSRPALEAVFAAVEKEVRELDELLSLEGRSAPSGGLRSFRSGPDPKTAPDARLLQTIERALGICAWSSGAHGPFGGDVNTLWGLRGGGDGIPGEQALAAAVAGNRCDLRLDGRKPDAALGVLRARLDLHGFRDGALVDRAVAVLLDQGIRHARVRLNGIVRAVGDAPAQSKGTGWPVHLPQVPGAARAETLFVRDRSLAVIVSFGHPLVLGGESFPRYFDLRTGRPVQGTLAVLVSTQTASDAESVAVALFSLGPREGQFRLGGLTPQPAARWVQGSGAGEPLLVDSRWSAVFGSSRRN